MLALPSLYQMDVPEHWRAIDFISDLHLSPQQPRTFEAWAAFMRGGDADAVMLLGDVFEAWVGDDARLGGFEARCLDVLADAAASRHVGFMVGNRDFLVGHRMLSDCGAIALPDPTALGAWGRCVLLTHGDLLCQGDTEYQAFRTQVRSEAWTTQFLSQPLAARRQQAQAMRDASERHKAKQSRDDWVDIDPAIAVAWMHAAGARDMVHGHTHHPQTQVLAPGFTRHVLSDWDLDAAVPRAEVLRITRSGFERRSFSA